MIFKEEAPTKTNLAFKPPKVFDTCYKNGGSMFTKKIKEGRYMRGCKPKPVWDFIRCSKKDGFEPTPEYLKAKSKKTFKGTRCQKIGGE